MSILARIDTEKQRGTWRDSTLLARATTLTAAGRKDEALVACRLVVADPEAEPRHQKAAQEMIQGLE